MLSYDFIIHIFSFHMTKTMIEIGYSKLRHGQKLAETVFGADVEHGNKKKSSR